MNSKDINFTATTIDEQETSINLDYTAKRAYVYTSRIAVARKLNDMLLNHPDEASIVHVDQYGYEIAVPMSWIVIRPKTKRNISEERRSELAQKLAAAREAKQK